MASTYLCRNSEHALTGYILYSNNVLFRMWDHLEDAIREGTPRWKQTFGIEGGIFDHFFRTEEAKQTFLQGMHGFGLLSSPKVVEAFDLSRFRRLVDLGGATGHLAIAACEQYPDLRAVVFDLPQVIEAARAHANRSAAAQRIAVMAGDFFRDELPDADLFAIGRILHDWSEDKIQKLACHDLSAPASGRRHPDFGETTARGQELARHRPNCNPLICWCAPKARNVRWWSTAACSKPPVFAMCQGRTTGSPLDAVLASKP